MNEILSLDRLDDFERLTSYDIKKYFSEFITFVDVDYANITNYYTQKATVNPTKAFDRLKWLIKENIKVIDVIILNSPSLDNYDYWSIVEYIEESTHVLQTANNASKWLRSSITGDGYRQQVLGEYLTKQGEDLEKVERSVLKSNNWTDDWVKTALENELREEDYDLEGGALIKVIFKNNSSILLESVIDNINTPEKTYGKDVDRRISIQDDDLVVLDYQETILQSAKILTDLNRGDDPYFPERGKNIKSILGGSLAAISYPTLFRELAANFATDDSFRSFQISDVKKGQQDAVYVEFKVETKAGDVFNQSSQI